MPIAKAGGLRRPTAQKRLDSGAIGRNTWFTVQSGLDLDYWWVTQRHLEAVSTILPGGRVYYLYYLVIVSTFLPGGSVYYLTWR